MATKQLKNDNTKQEKTFFIIEDHYLMRQGIADWLCENSDWTILGQAENAAEALEKLNELASSRHEDVNLDRQIDGLPFLAIVDINLGNDDGITLSKQIHEFYPKIKILIYSMHKTPALVRNAFDSGVSGFISKDCNESELLNAMEVIHSGKKFVEPALLNDCFEWQSILDSLTRREREVLGLVGLGLDNAEIAEKLNVEKRVVENYISRLYAKTGAKSRAELKELNE